MLIFKIILLLSISSIAHANSWLQNSEQQGEAEFNQENYSQAVELFDDPYKRGVALYKDGQYVAAAEAFNNVERSEVSLDAQYNLANSYFQQKEYEKAIKTYEQVLATQSDHADARHNLKLAKNSIQKDSKPSESEDSKDKDSKDENSEQQDSQQQDSQNSEQSENSQSQQ
ncbi:MAG: tetratricopeptide repeat protein, partial [Candidatus Marithrix sp.]|nr:tetratricopeptide repeat protein [Candidatus Marithrix sp.]